MVPLRKGQTAVLACVCALAMAFVAAAIAPAYALTVSGRAFVVFVNMPNVGINDQYYVDTGWLPPEGGVADQTMASLEVPNLVTSGTLGAHSHGDHCRGDSDFSATGGVLLPGDPAEITFGHMGGHDDDECCDKEDAPHAATIDGLTFGGQPITVTGAYDQIVMIAGVGTLIVNEHGHGHGDGDDCHDGDDHWVNALHLTLDGGGEIIVGSAYFHSHDHCCVVSTSASTWGGIKALYQSK